MKSRQQKRDEAEDRAAKYVAPERPIGLRELYKRGFITKDEALAKLSNGGSPNAHKRFIEWLGRQQTKKLVRNQK